MQIEKERAVTSSRGSVKEIVLTCSPSLPALASCKQKVSSLTL